MWALYGDDNIRHCFQGTEFEQDIVYLVWALMMTMMMMMMMMVVMMSDTVFRAQSLNRTLCTLCGCCDDDNDDDDDGGDDVRYCFQGTEFEQGMVYLVLVL